MQNIQEYIHTAEHTKMRPMKIKPLFNANHKRTSLLSVHICAVHFAYISSEDGCWLI